MKKAPFLLKIRFVLAMVVPCKTIQYDTQFWPQNIENHVETLKELGTWKDECNGDLEKTLVQFPTQNLSSVCTGLLPLGFRSDNDETCIRAQLSCAETNDTLQWTNYRQKDQLVVDLQWDILDLKVTMTEESALSVEYPRDKVMEIKRERSSQECSHGITAGIFKKVRCSEDYVYHVGVFMTSSALYHYKLESKEMLYFRINRSESDEHIRVVQEGVTTTATRRPLLHRQELIPNEKGLDNLFKIAAHLNNGLEWGCSVLDHLNCQTNDVPRSQKWLINHGFFDNTIIYLNVDLVTKLVFTITLETRISYHVEMMKKGKAITIRGNNGLCFTGFGVQLPSERVLMAIHERSLLFHVPNTLKGQVAFECIIDELTIANTYSIEIVTDDPIQSIVLLSNWLHVQTNQTRYLVIGVISLVVLLAFLILILVCYKQWCGLRTTVASVISRDTSSSGPKTTQSNYSNQGGKIVLDSPSGYYDVYKNRNNSADPHSSGYAYYTTTNDVADYYV